MIPTLDHRAVWWWGERGTLTRVNLENYDTTEYPMALGSPLARLVTYDIMPLAQKLVYIMYEEGEYRMIYLYDLKKTELTGAWRYENPICKKNPEISQTRKTASQISRAQRDALDRRVWGSGVSGGRRHHSSVHFDPPGPQQLQIPDFEHCGNRLRGRPNCGHGVCAACIGADPGRV